MRPDDKPFRWPEYLGVIRERHRCPTDVLIVCITGAVARWAARPIVLGHSGSVVHPIILTPDMFPKITDEATAVRLPMLAALSLASHPYDEGARIAAQAAPQHLTKQDQIKGGVYHDLLLALLVGPARTLGELDGPDGGIRLPE